MYDMYGYVCMYGWMYACIYVSMYVCMHVCKIQNLKLRFRFSRVCMYAITFLIL
jgi:hypothetical protein